MTANYGFLLKDARDNIPSSIHLLAGYLNTGTLSLLLGAGVSLNLGLPLWKDLVLNIADEVQSTTHDRGRAYNTTELKGIISSIKDSFDGDDERYFLTVKKHLYHGVKFDFSTANKDLLIALSAMIVGKKRGTIRNIVSYNFDSILEWYLGLLGLDINTLSKNQLLERTSDITIAHVHGYLPHSEEYGIDSDFLIFSQEEFQLRLIDDRDYWRGYLIEFLRRNIFLSVGVSAATLENDVRPYIDYLNLWYARESIQRMWPIGIAFLTPGTSNEQAERLLKIGVIPVTVEKENIPEVIFQIAQAALKK